MTKITVEKEEYHQSGFYGPYGDRSVDHGYMLLPGTTYTERGNPDTYDGEWYPVKRTQYGDGPYQYKELGPHTRTEEYRRHMAEFTAWLKQQAKQPSSNT